ncbi:caspase family protein [Spirosoma litoris]
MKTLLLSLSLVVSLLAIYPTNAQIRITSLTATTPARRVALVVGNNAYQNVPPLKKSLNDAADVAQALKSLQFEVTTLTNVTYAQFMTGFAEFREKLHSTDVALLYFSVHAGNHKGHYYLMPIDAKADCDLATSSIDLRNLLSTLNECSVPNSFVLLDAGNGSFQLNECSTATDHSIPPIIPKGGMLVYAAEPGSMAIEGSDGRNSVFTSELLKHLTTSDLSIRTIIDRTAKGVTAQTNGKQSLVRYDRLTSDFKFSRMIPQPDSSITNLTSAATKPVRQGQTIPLVANLSRFVPPVVDQKNLSTCVPWATAYYAYTTQYGALHMITDTSQLKQIALSPMLPYKQLRPDCTKGLGLADIARYIQEKGDVSYAEYPDLSCSSVPSADMLAKAQTNRPIKDVIKLFGISNTDSEKIHAILGPVGNSGKPVIVGIEVTKSFSTLNSTDEYYKPSGLSIGLQAVTVVGYDIPGRSFLMVNSYGKSWGNKGFFRMRFDDFAKAALGGIVLVLSDEPSHTSQKIISAFPGR